jgi:hypothetical protein
MTIEHSAAFVIGTFLFVVVLIWKQLRFIDTRLRGMRTELNELRTVETRLFMMALNANPKVEAASPVEPKNTAAKSDGGEGQKSHAEVTMVPPWNPVEVTSNRPLAPGVDEPPSRKGASVR